MSAAGVTNCMLSGKWLEFLRSKKAVVLFDQIVSSGFNFLLVVFCARAMSSPDFVTFSYLLIGIYFFSALLQGFVSSPSMTIVPMLDESESMIYKSILFSMQVFVLGIVLPLYFLFIQIGEAFGGGENVANFIWLKCLYIVTRLMQEFSRKFYISQSEHSTALALDATMSLVTIVGLGFLSFNNATSLFNVLMVLSAGSACATWFPYREIRFGCDRTLLMTLISRHCKIGLWLAFTSMVSAFGGTFIHMAAGMKLGGESMAVLRIAANLTRFLNLIIQTVENYLPQKAAKLVAAGFNRNDVYSEVVIKVTTRMFFLFLAVGAIFFVWSGLIVKSIYGDAFAQQSSVVSYYLLIPLVSGLALPSSIYIRSYEVTKILFRAYVVSLIPALLSIDLLLSEFGAMGAATAMLMSQIIYFGLIVYFSFRIRQNNF